jgi:hypothetical protein
MKARDARTDIFVVRIYCACKLIRKITGKISSGLNMQQDLIFHSTGFGCFSEEEERKMWGVLDAGGGAEVPSSSKEVRTAGEGVLYKSVLSDRPRGSKKEEKNTTISTTCTSTRVQVVKVRVPVILLFYKIY